jgi:hypothetical protein
VGAIQETFSRSKMGSLHYMYDTSNEAVDVPALSLYLGKIILKDSAPGLVAWTPARSPSPTRLRSASTEIDNASESFVGWVCVPITAYRDRTAPDSSNQADQSKSPRTPRSSSAGRSGFGGSSGGSTDEYLVIQLGFSSQSAWEKYKHDVMDDDDDDDGVGGGGDDNMSVATTATRETDSGTGSGSGLQLAAAAARNAKEMSLFAARAMRSWIKNQKKILFLNQRNNSFNIMRLVMCFLRIVNNLFILHSVYSSLNHQLTGGLASIAHSINDGSIVTLESLAAAITFLFRTAPTLSDGAIPMEAEHKGNVANIIKAIRFVLRHDLCWIALRIYYL